jgi:Flp pilus assembly protein TadD
MIFSRKEVSLYLVLMLALGWLLYPSDYTRGLMHADEGNRSYALSFFKDYLARHPYHKGATMALASAYEAAGLPDQGIDPLLSFYRHRRGDMETGAAVLNLMERTGDSTRAAQFRWELLSDIKNLPHPPKARLEELLYQAYQEAAASQDDASSLRALTELADISTEGGYRDMAMRLLLERRYLDAALTMLRDASRRSPKDIELRRSIIRIDRLRNDDDAALAECKEALKAAPNDVRILSDRVEIFVSRRRWDLAESDLRSLVRIQPKQDEWIRQLSRYLIESGNLKDGLRLNVLLVKRNLNDKQTWWNAIYGYADHGYHDQSAKLLKVFLHRFPDDSNGLKMLLYEQERSGRIDLAIAVLQRRVQAAPSDPARRRELAAKLVEAKRLPEAVKQYEALVKLQPQIKKYWWNIVYAYADHGYHQKAAERLEGFVRRFPNEASGLDMLVYERQLSGRDDLAIAALRRRVRAVPSDTTRRRSLASLLVESERIPEAVKEYEVLVKLQPQDKDLWMTLSYLQEAHGDTKGAARALKNYLARDPGDGKVVESLAGIYIKLGQKSQAIDLLRTYLRPSAGGRP